MKTPVAIWFTGLSGSGKSTLATALQEWLLEHDYQVKILDGDEVRATFHTHLGFSREDIITNNHLIVKLIQQQLPNYDVILVPVIAPFQETRDHARQVLGQQYVEVYVAAPVAVCKERDVKGLYQQAERGEIANFIGIDPATPYETPAHPDITIDTTTGDVTDSLQSLLAQLGLPV